MRIIYEYEVYIYTLNENITYMLFTNEDIQDTENVKQKKKKSAIGCTINILTSSNLFLVNKLKIDFFFTYRMLQLQYRAYASTYSFDFSEYLILSIALMVIFKIK